jgi:triosephosphate isomerase
MSRQKLIAGNWKMYKTVAEAVALVRDLRGMVSMVRDRVEVVVAPPFTALHAVGKALEGSNVGLAGQNVFWESVGAYTGEVAPAMLREAGCGFAIVGHSERRQYFGETDETVARRVHASLRAGLVPIVCVGETLAEREAGKTLSVVERQVRKGLSGLAAAEIARLVLAYEPVWAIGTGKTATSEEAQEVHAHIRGVLRAMHGEETASGVRIIYGGSVKPENAGELMGKPDIDGALVGGASLKADDFARIVKSAV